MGKAWYWFPQSLLTRVLLLYATALLLVVSLGFGAFASHKAHTLVEDADSQVSALVNLMVPAVTEAAVIGDYDTIKRQIERSLDHPMLREGAFIDLKGARIQAHRQIPPLGWSPGWLRQRVSEQLGDVNATINVGGRDYGVLRLRLWHERIASEIWREAMLALGLALLGLLMGVGLVWWPLRRWLGNLQRIQDFGKQLERQGGSLSEVRNEHAPLEFRRTFDVLNRAAASLQAERAQAAVTLAAIADGVLTTNREGRVVLVNPVLAGWLGRPAAELLDQPLAQLLPGVPRPEQAEPGQRVELPGPQGVRVLELSCSAVRSEAEGRAAPAGWVYALRDVSSQHALERQLQQELQARALAMRTMHRLLEEFQQREGSMLAPLPPDPQRSEIEALLQLVSQMVQQLGAQAGQLQAIFALSPDGFVSLDAQQRVHYVSPAFERLTGLSAASLLGRESAELEARLQARLQDEAGALQLQQLQSGRRLLQLRPPNERMLELAQHQGEGPEVQRVLHVRDVTHQVEVDRIKSEFLSMAAHELRTPMTSIYGFTELMLLRPLTPERQREALQKIHRQSEAMIGILNELLDLSRLEARRGQDFRFESLPAQAVVQEAVQDFSPPESREPPLLELAEFPLPVHVDRGKLQQVMRNLLSNAYKYSPQGGRVWVRLRAEGDEQVLIEVQDQGIGMSAEELAHVSERFYRADKSGSIPGTGLGMSIVKEILELMSGSLRLSSVPGQGTTVQVRLPAAGGLSPARPAGSGA